MEFQDGVQWSGAVASVGVPEVKDGGVTGIEVNTNYGGDQALGGGDDTVNRINMKFEHGLGEKAILDRY